MFHAGPQWRAVPRLAAIALAGALLAAAAGAAGAGTGGPGAARLPAGRAGAPNLDWPQYLHGPQHSSVSNATAFTPSDAGSLPCAVMGAPSLDGAGVLAVATYGCTKPGTPAAYLVSAATGVILSTLPTGASKVFAQPVFAQGTLLVATASGGLYDLAPAAARS